MLEQKLHDVQMPIFSRLFLPNESSPQAMETGMMSSGSFKLTRSWSCRADLMTDSIESTPLNWFEREFPGRPEGLRRKLPLLTYDANARSLSRNDSQSSIGTASIDEQQGKGTKTSADVEITSIQTFVAGLKQMAKLDYEKQLVDDHVRPFLFTYILTSVMLVLFFS